MPKTKCLSKNGCLAAYNLVLDGLRRTNPKEPLLEIRAWCAVAQAQIVLFGRSAGIPYFATRIVALLVGLVFAALYWPLTGAVLILDSFASKKKIMRRGRDCPSNSD